MGLLRKKEEKQSVTSQTRAQDGLDVKFPQYHLDYIVNKDLVKELLSINIDEGELSGYDWRIGFKDRESFIAVMSEIYPSWSEVRVEEDSSKIGIGYQSKNKKDYILLNGYARNIDDSKGTVEITDTEPTTIEKFETFKKSPVSAALVGNYFYSPVILKTSTESLIHIRDKKNRNPFVTIDSEGVQSFPTDYFVCQRFSITGPFECEQEDVFINKRSEEIKDKLRPIYAMYEAAKAGDFSKIKIGLANDPTGDKTKKIIRKFNENDFQDQVIKRLPKFFEMVTEGIYKGAYRQTRPSEYKELDKAQDELYKTNPELVEHLKVASAFNKHIERFNIKGAVAKDESAHVEAAAAP